ncbi:hypothetical protein [Rubrobacter indicoceani]|uniref:hypothetical protein n=1 Tax=Rubrobacter indicoceani TaxID=2051957 RepID=UPI000E5B29CD|nr:hypothetical protein [Rubrobacter indicoceani]
MDARVGIFVDYKSEYARGVAEAVWSGLSRAAVSGGGGKISTYWDGLDRRDIVAIMSSKAPPRPRNWDASVFVVGQDLPDAVDTLTPLRDTAGDFGLCGVVVATPEAASPLAGSLLYQGVEHLQQRGVRAGNIEPALLRGFPDECEAYARRLLERLGG